MRAKILIAAIGIVIVSAGLVLWMPAPEPVVATPPGAPVASTAANEPTQSRERENPSVLSRSAQPGVENEPAQLLARIQNALGSPNPDDRDIVFTTLLEPLVRIDPLAAARIAEKNNPGDTHDLVLHRVAQLWAAQDAPAVLDWAKTLTKAEDRDAILTDVCLQISESDPEGAVLIRSLYVTDERPDGGLEMLAQRWAQSDFPSALGWALARKAGEQRDQLVARLAYVQSQVAPIEAATLTVEKIPAGRAQTEAVMAVLHQWALRDPAAAGKWVAVFPEGELRTRAINELSGIAQSRPESSD